MTTQYLRQQVIHIADELKISHGDDYSSEVCKAYFELLDTYPTDKISTLQIIINAFSDTIDYDNKDKIIASLQKKLKELEATIKLQNKKIDNLEATIKLQDITIQSHEATIKNQDATIKNQDKKITDLETRLTKQETNQLFNKYVIGIQDLNRIELLETQLADARELKKLKNDRINGCHYINDDYNNNEKAIRINLLIDKIENVPSEIKELFEDEYPGLLDDLKLLLAKRLDVVEDARFIKKSNRWWE